MRGFKLLIFLIVFISQPVCAEAQPINKVVAVVNDEVITQQDVDQLLAVLYAQYVHEHKGDELLERMEEVKKDILMQMIEDKLVLSRAKELDVKVSAREIDEKLEYVKNGFPSEKDFYGMLEAQGITVADLKDRYRDQMMMKKLIDFEIKSKVSVLPSEISDYYERHRPQFKLSDTCRVRHILIKADDIVSFSLAEVEMRGIYNKLIEGQDFAALARRFSQGLHKDKGGDMGYIKQGEMLEELNKAIALLKPGEFSRPIKSRMGYHIVKVEDIRDSEYLSFEYVQKDIKKMLFQEKLKQRLDEWLAELSSNAYISIK